MKKQNIQTQIRMSAFLLTGKVSFFISGRVFIYWLSKLLLITLRLTQEHEQHYSTVILSATIKDECGFVQVPPGKSCFSWATSMRQLFGSSPYMGRFFLPEPSVNCAEEWQQCHFHQVGRKRWKECINYVTETRDRGCTVSVWMC